MASKMMHCEKATFLVNTRDQQKLKCKDRISLQVHLMSCHLCRTYTHQITELNTHIEKCKKATEEGDFPFVLTEDEKTEMKNNL